MTEICVAEEATVDWTRLVQLNVVVVDFMWLEKDRL